MKKNFTIINTITNSAVEQDPTINSQIYNTNIANHYTQYKDSLNLISGDQINFGQKIKIVITKYKKLQTSKDPIPSKVFTEVANTVVSKQTLIETYPLTQLTKFDEVYTNTLETMQGLAVRCSNYISSVARAFQDGLFYNYRDYLEYVDQNKEKIIDALKKDKK